jgi:hypothetical protein
MLCPRNTGVVWVSNTPRIMETYIVTENESPRDRMARHFGLGDYGKRLADEILRDYGTQICGWLHANDAPTAAELVKEFNALDFE